MSDSSRATIAGASLVLLCAFAQICARAQDHAATRRSVYTSIANKDCTFDASGPEAGAEEDQSKRCPGLAGSQAIINAGGTTVSLDFRWPAKGAKAEKVVVGWSLGEKLEWRGSGTGNRFEPDTVILRILLNPEEDRIAKHQVLAVVRVGAGNACLIGAVDMKADATPYDTARRLSDESGIDFRCGKDSAKIGGPPTPYTKLVLDRRAR